MKTKPVAIITGVASGIGRAAALKFANKGFVLSLVDIDVDGLNSLAMELEARGANFLCMAGDLEDFNFLEEVTTRTAAKWKRIDVLINSAVWRTLETMRTISADDWNKTIRICLTAPAFLARNTASIMEKNGQKGVIVNISSIMSHRTGGISPAYSVCKGGLESLTYELAVLYGPVGIRVVGITPGNIDTALSRDYTDGNAANISAALSKDMNDNTPLQRMGSPAEIADIAYWICSEEASFITGTFILADGGFLHNLNSYQIKKLQRPREF